MDGLGQRIRKLRIAKHLTQKELARKLFVTDKAISKWEGNRGDPSLQLLVALSEIFEISIDELLLGKKYQK